MLSVQTDFGCIGVDTSVVTVTLVARKIAHFFVYYNGSLGMAYDTHEQAMAQIELCEYDSTAKVVRMEGMVDYEL